MQIINFYKKKIEEPLSTCLSACLEAGLYYYLRSYPYLDRIFFFQKIPLQPKFK